MFFQWFGAPESRKVGSLKRRVRSHLARWEMKSCTPLWRNAHFQVKSVKTWRSRSTFGSWDVEKVYAAVARSTIPMFIRDVRRLGRYFPEEGCILEHQICRFDEMILRDRYSTSYDLASISGGRRNTLDRWSGKIAKRIATWPSALHSTFHFWRKSRRIASFLMLSTSKIEEVSQKSSSKVEEVLQNCFVFKLADRQTDR